jgi:hypothetical protein
LIKIELDLAFADEPAVTVEMLLGRSKVRIGVLRTENRPKHVPCPHARDPVALTYNGKTIDLGDILEPLHRSPDLDRRPDECPAERDNEGQSDRGEPDDAKVVVSWRLPSPCHASEPGHQLHEG